MLYKHAVLFLSPMNGVITSLSIDFEEISWWALFPPREKKTRWNKLDKLQNNYLYCILCSVFSAFDLTFTLARTTVKSKIVALILTEMQRNAYITSINTHACIFILPFQTKQLAPMCVRWCSVFVSCVLWIFMDNFTFVSFSMLLRMLTSSPSMELPDRLDGWLVGWLSRWLYGMDGWMDGVCYFHILELNFHNAKAAQAWASAASSCSRCRRQSIMKWNVKW